MNLLYIRFERNNHKKRKRQRRQWQKQPSDTVFHYVQQIDFNFVSTIYISFCTFFGLEYFFGKHERHRCHRHRFRLLLESFGLVDSCICICAVACFSCAETLNVNQSSGKPSCIFGLFFFSFEVAVEKRIFVRKKRRKKDYKGTIPKPMQH